MGGILQICWPAFPAIARAPVEKLSVPVGLRNVTGKMVGTALGFTVTATNFASASPVATVPSKRLVFATGKAR